MLTNKNPYIDSPYQKLQLISQDKEKRLEYEAREKAIRDYNEGIVKITLLSKEKIQKL
jgi:hypothetical protein